MQTDAISIPGGTARATLNYIADTGARQVFYNDDPHCGSLTFDPREVEIEDVSFAGQPPSLEAEGFQLFPHQTGVRDLALGRGAGSEAYGREMEALIRGLSGADFVRVGPRQGGRRQDRTDIDFAAGRVAPATFVHNDTSHGHGRDYTAMQGAPEPGRKIRRMATYKQWRLVSPPPTNLPFALVDARSVAPEDMVAADSTVRSGGAWLEMAVLRHNPAHRWCYFSQMGYDDLIVFKQYDSDAGQPWCAPHSAFSNKLVGDEAAPRVNYESVVVAYWYED